MECSAFLRLAKNPADARVVRTGNSLAGSAQGMAGGVAETESPLQSSKMATRIGYRIVERIVVGVADADVFTRQQKITLS
jgi:hypothetical protein